MFFRNRERVQGREWAGAEEASVHSREPRGLVLPQILGEWGNTWGQSTTKQNRGGTVMVTGITGNMRILFFNENIFSGNRKRDACKDNALTVSSFIHFNIFKAESVFI